MKVSPLLLLGALWERLHVELCQVPAVLVPAEVPLGVQTSSSSSSRQINEHSKTEQTKVSRPGFSLLSYLGEPHTVPLVGRLLCLGRVHQLEARLILLVEVGVLAAASKLRGILV